MIQPLHDIRVLDLSRVYAAPAGAMKLGDLGADVIRVEPPGGSDSMRDWGPFISGESTYYLSANRNKRSITLNLKSAEGKKLFLDLVEKSDVVIENFKAGTMKKLGLDYDVLKVKNPGIIVCSVTGFGQTGPLGLLPGFDPVIQAMSGLMDVTGDPNGEATKVGIPIADIITSVYVALSVVAAIRQRDISGEGQYIDLSLLDVQVASMANVASAYLNTGMISVRKGNQHNNVTPYQVFQTGDYPIMICAGNDNLFGKFVTSLGQPEWKNDERFVSNNDRKQYEDELVRMIEDVLKTKTSTEWIRILSEAKVPVGQVNTIQQALEQEQITARGGIERLIHPVGEVKMLASPLKHSGLNVKSRLSPPTLGQHTEEVFQELLGMNKEDITILAENRVL
ncbi:CaiB/BaiF CoA-transferase family protein [Psychrobacillus sp. OK032]|uniref:CaiB/BaiF CoA transferase family protein n=1 Tax=Psychrobacillus sp. OK032 TaxID=1884358 RepID=UPI0008B8528C|nr:CaiB/BaiF CoA-transferase family protein [Psychrobacillus sp. OK032]SER69636.1 Crotonobetainyl-CoA:carnitine CoA-transferase CaiB [Psychrobacillus sp. OK032]